MDHSGTFSPPANDAGLAAADEMFAKRSCCCFYVPWSGVHSQKTWERIQPTAERSDGDRLVKQMWWWSKGFKAFQKIREWSELWAGPRWKTFIRRFGRGGRPVYKFGYDPLSYSLNFDDGQVQGSDSYCPPGFSMRYAAPPSSAKSSMDFGERDVPPLFSDGH